MVNRIVNTGNCRWQSFSILIMLLVLSGCVSSPRPIDNRPDNDGPPQSRPSGSADEPVPKFEPRSRYGNKSPYVVLGKTYRVLPDSKGYRANGIASWYGRKFHGRKTSSGEVYDMFEFTAAHRELPLPTYAEVTNLANGRSVIVKINDRGPFHDDRIIDLSYAAAEKLDMLTTGTARVNVTAINVAPSADGVSLDTPIVLQVGAFSERSRARQVRRELLDGGIENIDIDAAQQGAQRFWRVRAGPYRKLDQLNTAEQRIRQLGYKNTIRITATN